MLTRAQVATLARTPGQKRRGNSTENLDLKLATMSARTRAEVSLTDAAGEGLGRQTNPP